MNSNIRSNSPSAETQSSPKKLCQTHPSPNPNPPPKITTTDVKKPEEVAEILTNKTTEKQVSSGKGGKRKRKQKIKPLSSSEESIEHSIKELLGFQRYQECIENEVKYDESGWDLEKGSLLEITIDSIGSFGDGLAISPKQNWILVVPFTVPGDRVEIKVYRNQTLHSFADLISVKSAGAWRNDSLVKCRYFGKCSGCQYQMISYDKQLELKQIVVEKAFKHFSGLDPSLIPPIEPTLPSPLQYEYRTKLTPHFELPRNSKQIQEGEQGDLRIGFAEKGRKRVMDIEDCMIATSVINQKLKEERHRVQSTIHTFKRGATLLLRDSLVPITQPDPKESESPCDPNTHLCITNHKEIVRENVQGVNFEQNAGSFFQNNSSILNPFMSYILSLLKPPESEERYLVDAYCGSGLFSISLAMVFTKAIGIELSVDSIRWAKHNALLNRVENVEFMVGQAEAIFKDLKFPASKTTIIIDPPRKGCDELFIHQLLDFKPQTILYVSCNVHTQARDVGRLGKSYRIQSIRGADFFPQSHHCESIVCLSLVE